MKREAYLAIRELRTPMGKKFKGHVIEVARAVFENESIPAFSTPQRARSGISLIPNVSLRCGTRSRPKRLG